jgi:hypothetical protein
MTNNETAANAVVEVELVRNTDEELELAVRHVEAHAAFAHELWLEGRDRDELCPDAHADYFCSGSNLPGEIEGLAAAAENVGVAAPEVSEAAEQALVNLAGMLTKVFVDSGAFSEVGFGPQGPFVKEPITAEKWAERLGLYLRLAPVLRHQLYVVAPDQVAFQRETLERLQRYAGEMRIVRSHRANVIVPVQKGELPMAVFFDRARELLGFEPIAGVPMKKDATSVEELRAFVAAAQPRAVHLLGIGPDSRGFSAAVAAIREAAPNTRIFCDSVAIRRMVGRTNGKGKGPRRMTAAQDRVRAAKPGASSREVKREAARAVFMDDGARRVREGKAAGWYDAELFGSWEESQAWDAAGEAERDAWIPWDERARALPAA